MPGDKSKDAIAAAFASVGSLRTWRVKQIREDLVLWGDRPIEFDFNPEGTNLYSIEETLRAFCRRFSCVAECIEQLDKKTMLVPATILARALIETIAIGCLMAHDINRLLKAGNKDRFDARMQKYIAGMATGDIKPVHVLDGIRHLTEIDTNYFEYLAAKFEFMKRLLVGVVPDVGNEEEALAKAREALSVTAAYDLLSEIAHPNGLGTQFLFPDPSNEQFAAKVRPRLQHACGVAVWHGHHLLESLHSVEGFADQYQALFLA